MSRVFQHPRELVGQEGQTLGHSDWLLIDQARIDGFAAVSGDHQWIHVDVERARLGPYGRTIAHGYLTLSLTNHFLPQLIAVRGVRHALNIGVDRIRFLAPVPEGSRIRGAGEIQKVIETTDGAIQATILITVEIEGANKPACIVESISRYYPE
jgi:acyl dehydratase